MPTRFSTVTDRAVTSSGERALVVNDAGPPWVGGWSSSAQRLPIAPPGELERPVLVVAVEQQHERVVGDLLAVAAGVRDLLAVEEQASAVALCSQSRLVIRRPSTRNHHVGQALPG